MTGMNLSGKRRIKLGVVDRTFALGKEGDCGHFPGCQFVGLLVRLKRGPRLASLGVNLPAMLSGRVEGVFAPVAAPTRAQQRGQRIECAGEDVVGLAPLRPREVQIARGRYPVLPRRSEGFSQPRRAAERRCEKSRVSTFADSGTETLA